MSKQEHKSVLLATQPTGKPRFLTELGCKDVRTRVPPLPTETHDTGWKPTAARSEW